MNKMEAMIKGKAYELGYKKCGIIPISYMKGYAERFKERIEKVPESKNFYKSQYRLLNPLDKYPWAKSIIVLATRYGKYKIPESVKGHIAKAYLFDTRIDENSEEFQNRQILKKYMQNLGLKIAANHKFGIVGLRWAAMKAGIGIIRRNNFFYTQYGSWMHIEAWLTDRNMELIEMHNLKQCPKGCNRCIAACPTHSLSSSYTMLPTACISYLTTFGGRDLSNEPLRKKFGNCIYGCDICQDVCPMNKTKWEETYDFPNLSKLDPFLTPENILNMDEKFYKEKVQPKFFYLEENELWKWKVNVLNFMENNYQEKYKPYIISACENDNKKVSEIARLIRDELYI